ncbi:hypothetical protein G6F56_011618 [Rhizopus delemar]|nr:hypothetical protein G6F56_011618 [Rhizopus delemar]
MSTSYNVEYSTQIQNTQFVTPIAELKRRALVDKSNIEDYDIKNWISSAAQHYNHGDVALQNNDLENAYIAYMKGSTIMVEIVRHHSGRLNIKSDSVYISLRRRTDDILVLLKDLAIKIDTWHSYQHQLQQMSYYSAYPYTHPVYTERQTITPFQPRSSPLRTENNSLPHDFSNQLKISSVDLPPSWTHPVFPKNTIIQPYDLASSIQSQQNPPQVLLIDVRSRDKFNSGCIQHKWIIQIEPSILRKE